MSLTQDIKQKLTQLNVFEKLIVANVFVFFIAHILKLVLHTESSLSWFELPSNLSDFMTQPWAIVSYAFLHYDFFHILFNMLWLYIIGKMFINLFNTKLGLNVYFLGAISGAIVFLLGYLLLPNVFDSGHRLVGASAAVRALLIFMCAYMPNMDLRFFTFNIKLKHVGIAIVVLDFMGLFGGNAGGNLAHFGGTILGYFYGTQLHKGNDIGKGFERFMDAIVNFFKSNKSNLKTVHKKSGKVAGYTKEEFKEFNNQKQIDIILDKISKSGYDSLTKAEKELLFRAGK
ncbi:rhomboid family intramembrane serine protease [Lacinutrix iliipiscaria]|uniref:Rhomboid family intramembrane serine protease n=1 Tax=Lacinutrix iliipiscaria TaxID=1230532 RepID=A0ABW5WQN7_9FLAO